MYACTTPQASIGQEFWVFLWRGLLKQLEQVFCWRQPQFLQVSEWMSGVLRRLSHHLGFQASISDSPIYYRSGVNCHVHGTLWRHSNHGPNSRDEGPPHSSHLLQALHLLQGLQGQCRRIGISKTSQAAPLHQAHQRLLLSLSWTCKGLIKIFQVGTSNQIAYVPTKALEQNNFVCHCVHLWGK